MATNFYFNNFQSSMEQQLIEDLCIEAIKVYGMDMFYVPRTIVARDDIFQEDALSEYNKAIPVEMYIKNVDGFGGDGDFLSKFNIQIRDTITFTIARRTFFNEMSQNDEPLIERPREGDLVYFPLNRKIFKITFVEHEDIFYQMGSLQMWDLKCELFEYSGERLNTGLEDIDRIEWENSITADPLAILTDRNEAIVDEDGNMIIQAVYNLDELDPLAQNEELETAGDEFIDFTQIDPFSEGAF